MSEETSVDDIILSHEYLTVIHYYSPVIKSKSLCWTVQRSLNKEKKVKNKWGNESSQKVWWPVKNSGWKCPWVCSALTQTHTHTQLRSACKCEWTRQGADRCCPPFDHRVVCFLRPVTSDPCRRKVECLFSSALMIHLTPFSWVSVWYVLDVCVCVRGRRAESCF